MIQADFLVAAPYGALLTAFDCPTLGMVCGIRTAHESAIWIIPNTAIINPEALGRVHSSVRLFSADEMIKAFERLSEVGAIALCCDEAEKEIKDLYKKTPERSKEMITLCTHRVKPMGMNQVLSLLYKQSMDNVAHAFYLLLDELVQFERALFDINVPLLSELGPRSDRETHYQELMCFQDIRDELKNLSDSSSNIERKANFEGICADGLWREVALVRSTLTDELEQLQHEFPNFAAVTTYLMAHTELALRRRMPVQSWPPILLVGAPGCGKSAFFRRLAKTLNNDFFGADLSHMHGRFELVGLHPSWKSGTSGFLANAMLRSRYINPLIFLDEIDKANNPGQDGNLVNCLLTLLEPDSAKSFADQYLRLPMNASRILWCFAANNINLIPAPALSRMQVFHIRQPTEHEQLRIIQQMYRAMALSSDLEEALEPELPPEVVVLLVSKSVREVRLRLNLAIASAALRLKGSTDRIRLARVDIPMLQVVISDERRDGQTLH